MESEIDPALVGARLRRWRDELNLTGPDVAAKVATVGGRPFGWADLRRLELGEVLPDSSTTESLVAAFGRSVSELLAPKTASELEAEAALLNPDGSDDRPQGLKERSPYRPGRTHAAGSDVDWTLKPGEHIKRTLLHQQYGGGRQGGIAPSKESRNVLVFSDPLVGGQHGYHDRWNSDRTVFFYCGEGQQGDQQFLRGNRAIRDHHKDRRALRVFEGCSGEVLYAGEFVIDQAHPFDWETAESSGGGPQRRVIMFRLLPVL